ncbi:MAG: SirB2 family protein [Halioglobus sp.]
MSALYIIHVTCAVLSVAGFALRGYWLLQASPLAGHRMTRTLPHVIDTLLLFSAVAMLVSWRLSPMGTPWLLAKICALLLYIALGMLAFRFARSQRTRLVAWLMALVTAAYIVSVALSKNPWGFWAALAS